MFVVNSCMASSNKIAPAFIRAIMQVSVVLVCVATACGQQPADSGLARTQEAAAQDIDFPTSGPIEATEIGDGVWWHPELSETSITQVMSNLNKWNIRNLYVDVFRSGETLYPSTLFPPRPLSTDRDWFAYIIEEAHSHNIRVHAWAQTLCWHEPDDESPSTHPLLSIHPEWLDVAENGMVFDGKSMARYVSPGVPAVRNLIVGMTDELCSYPIDGISLDALEFNSRADTGYNAAVVSDFKESCGIDPTQLRQSLSSDSDWMKWVTFREDKLTSLVQLVSAHCRQTGNDRGRRILFSVTVQPGYNSTRGMNFRYQNWGQWLQLNLVDATIPLCFTPDLPGLEKQLWEARSVHMGWQTACIPGLLLDSKGPNVHPSLREQHQLLRNTGFQNFNIMDYVGLLSDKQAKKNVQPDQSGGFWNFWTPRRDSLE